MKNKTAYIFLLLLAITYHINGQVAFPYSKGRVKSRLSVGVVKSFYKNDANLTTNTKGKAGFDAAYKFELLLGRRTNLLLGLEYQSSGLTFSGYYEKPGYTYLFDGSYGYSHELRIQELQLPLSLKVAFNSEKENLVSPYFIGGIGARYIFSSYTIITNDSTGLTPFDHKDNIDFENQLLLDGLNAYFQIGLGLQYNKRHSANATYFELSYKYNISRIHYDGDDGSNDLNIRDRNLVFSVGIRF